MPPFVGTPGEVRRAIRDVLARPEYRWPEPNLLQRVQQWVTEQLERALGTVVAGGRGAVLVGIVALGGLVLMAAVGVRLARGITADPGRTVRGRAEPSRRARDWRSEAEEHERAGRWRQALRCRYRALVAELVERGVIEEVAGRTSGEYRREIEAALPATAEPLDGATALFEAAWYGGEPTGEREATEFRRLADEVLSR